MIPINVVYLAIKYSSNQTLRKDNVPKGHRLNNTKEEFLFEILNVSSFQVLNTQVIIKKNSFLNCFSLQFVRRTIALFVCLARSLSFSRRYGVIREPEYQ